MIKPSDLFDVLKVIEVSCINLLGIIYLVVCGGMLYRFLAVVLASIVLLAFIAEVAYSIVIRQDPSMPIESVIVLDHETLIKMISELAKELNDPLLKRYAGELAQAIIEGNYTKATEIVREIQERVRKTVNVTANTTVSEGLLKDIAEILSIAGVGSRGTFINVTELLKLYGKLSGDEEIIRLGKLISEETVLSPNEYQEIMNVISGIVGPGARHAGMADLIEATGTIMPRANVSVSRITSPKVGGLIESVKTISYYILPLALAGVLIYMFRSRIYTALTGLKRFLGMMGARIIIGLHGRYSYIKDPVIRLYRLFIELAGRLGYRRYRCETPREFLGKIRDHELKSVGEEITLVYERRVYGCKSVEEKTVDDLRRELMRLGRLESED